jgi:hypothetical protein
MCATPDHTKSYNDVRKMQQAMRLVLGLQPGASTTHLADNHSATVAAMETFYTKYKDQDMMCWCRVIRAENKKGGDDWINISVPIMIFDGDQCDIKDYMPGEGPDLSDDAIDDSASNNDDEPEYDDEDESDGNSDYAPPTQPRKGARNLHRPSKKAKHLPTKPARNVNGLLNKFRKHPLP